MSLLALAGTNSATGGYEIENSCKFEADNTELIYRTNNSGTNRKTFTVSAWFKRTELGVDQQVWHGGNNGEATRMGILSYQYADDNLWVDVGGGSGNTGTLYRSYSTQKIRDTSAWYHFVLAVDTTQATEANRMKVWLNGEEVTDWAQHQIPAQDFQCALESGIDMAWGGYRPNNVVLLSGYLAECHYLDGVTAVQTDFGEYDEDSGIWKPKAYAGSYGGNGCYLNFDDSASLGADSSGNGNTFTLNNITAADQATDTPTNNFCTWMPLWAFPKVAGIEEGGTKTNGDFNASTWRGAKGSMGVSRGKWYWENKASGTDTIHGWQTDNCVPDSGSNSHNVISTIALYEAGNYIWLKDSTSGRNDSSVTGTYAGGQVIGFALNLDSSPQTATFYRNGSAIATDVNIDGLADQTLFPMTSHYNQTSQANFGGYTSMSNAHTNTDENGYGSFVYAPPSGFYALCTKNLEEFG
jgi:hypothetical protein